MTRPFIPRRACVREKAHKGKKRNERARDSTKRRRDATHTHTHTHKIPRVGADSPARARERRRRASPRRRRPGACFSPNKTSRSPRADVPKQGGVRRKHARTERNAPEKQQTNQNKKTKRQRGFPACSQASTNAPQAGLSSLFRWGRLIFCWCERLMVANVRGVCITMTTCIGRDTLMGHLCTTRLPRRTHMSILYHR